MLYSKKFEESWHFISNKYDKKRFGYRDPFMLQLLLEQ